MPFDESQQKAAREYSPASNDAIGAEAGYNWTPEAASRNRQVEILYIKQASQLEHEITNLIEFRSGQARKKVSFQVKLASVGKKSVKETQAYCIASA